MTDPQKLKIEVQERIKYLENYSTPTNMEILLLDFLTVKDELIGIYKMMEKRL